MARASLLHAPRGEARTADNVDFGSLGEFMALVAHSSCIEDQRVRNARMGVLSRTMSGISGTVGGFGVKPEWADSVFDQARQIDGPFARCQFRSCQAREFQWPIFGGSSRTNGSRWGGMSAAWGLSEIANLNTLANSQPALGNVVFALQPCAIYSGPISRDLLSDSELIAPALDYAARAEIRYALEYGMINGRGGYSTAGPGSIAGPQGVIGAGCTVTVPKGSTGSNAIAAPNIDAMWGAIASGNKRNSVWHCNDNTLASIDELAVSGQWSESIYIAAGRYGNEYPLIKGRPVICTEACPEIGTPGDLICVCWDDYWCVLHKPKPTDSGLAFSLTIPPDSGHLGVVGMPADAIEARRSDEFLWSTDSVAFMWRLRLDGNFLWPGAVTDAQGNQVGPAAVIAQR